jgi:hypothetical protein
MLVTRGLGGIWPGAVTAGFGSRSTTPVPVPTTAITGGGPEVRMPRRKRAHARDYDFLNSVATLRDAAARKALGVKKTTPQTPKNPPTPSVEPTPPIGFIPEPYVPISIQGLEMLSGGLTAAQVAKQNEMAQAWAKAILAMERDRVLRAEDDELFLLLCASVAN